MNGKIINIPNLLTLARIVLTPFIVYAIMSQAAVHALILMLIAGLTDMFDGAIAKHFNQRTVVGSYMDPIADKLMLISAIISLFMIDQTPLFLFLAVIFRDVIIVVGAVAYELVTRRLEMQPTMTSKATTAMQITYVAMALLHMAGMLPALAVTVAIWVTFLLTCISGLHYMWAWTEKAIVHEGKQ
ncbi:MAG TPA: CDP-alcohol phosphatidyltransferase family protein [Mariprofundaceae bacterium]|nr:CDP-alcohol phosphatidyltransferase family protein [Mariprofundaceae bacterium]